MAKHKNWKVGPALRKVKHEVDLTCRAIGDGSAGMFLDLAKKNITYFQDLRFMQLFFPKMF